MGAPRIQLERKETVAVVTLNRADKQNAFDAEMFTSLEATAEQIRADLPRAIVVTGGGGKAFCAGFDVSLDNPMTARFLEAVNTGSPALAGQVIGQMRQAVDTLVSLPVPIIAAVNGLAYGGGAELATRCDLRVMDDQAEVCFSEVRLGLMPDWGGGPCLARLVGPGRAADLILTARVVGASEALALGWANRVSKAGNCVAEAMALAEQIGTNGPRAVQAALAVLRSGQGLEADLELESRSAAGLIASGECVHGITALMEKRPPRFPD